MHAHKGMEIKTALREREPITAIAVDILNLESGFLYFLICLWNLSFNHRTNQKTKTCYFYHGFFSAINVHKKKAHSLRVPFEFGLRRSQTVVDVSFAIIAYQ